MSARHRTITLAEGQEDLADEFVAHADAGITDLELEFDTTIRLRLRLNGQPHFAAIGELDRVDQHVHENLAHPRRIAAYAPTGFRRDVEEQVQSLGFGLLRDDLDRRLDAGQGVEFGRVDRHLAGLDAREVEHVVDQAQQQVAAGANGLEQLALTTIEIGVDQQPGHAEHGIHRRAQLVAGRSQETRFRA